MKMTLIFEDDIDSKKGNAIYNRYHNLLSDKTILAISETDLNIKLEDMDDGSTPVLNAIRRQLNSMTANTIDIVEVVNNYNDISQPFPVRISKVWKEYERTNNTAFLCSAICKKLASDAMNCGSNYAKILSEISKYGNMLIEELRITAIRNYAIVIPTITTPIYDPKVMMIVSAINVLVDIMFTCIPAHKMFGVVNILRFWGDKIPMCVHRIPKDSYQYLLRRTNLPKHIKLVVDEECMTYPKTNFIFNYSEYQMLCDQFHDIYAFFQHREIISTYRDPMLTKFLIQKLDDISKNVDFAEFCDEYKKEIIEQCGSLLKEPV